MNVLELEPFEILLGVPQVFGILLSGKSTGIPRHGNLVLVRMIEGRLWLKRDSFVTTNSVGGWRMVVAIQCQIVVLDYGEDHEYEIE